MNSDKKSLGILGFGAFGRFMAKHMLPWVTVKAWDRQLPEPDSLPEDIREVDLTTLEQASACDIVVFAVPWDALEETALAAKPYLREGALVIDVTSVKMGPAELLPRVLPDRVEILCTHPMFGPQSGKNGISGLRIALCPVRIDKERYYQICDFLTDKLSLLVLKTTPEKHDREMAKVQAVTHFMSRALRDLGLQPSPMATRAYEKLQEFSAIVLSDSWDLFLTIQNGNPYAQEVRRDLMRRMEELESQLHGGKGKPLSERRQARCPTTA